MVLQLQSKGSKLAAGLSGLREGLAQGFAMGTTARRTQLAEREQQAQEERYKQSVALASQAAALDKQREDRYAAEAARNNQLQDEQRQGMRDLTNSRIDSITPEQTEPGFINEGGMLYSDFKAGLMQHHDRVLKHAKEASKNIPPEFLDRFWGDVSAGLQNDQQKAQIAKFQSDLEGFGHDANTELGSGPVQDLMGEPGDGKTKKGSGALGRFGELKGILDTIAGQDPMLASSPEERQKMLAERQKQLQVIAQGIGQTHDQLNKEELRREEVASTVTQYQQAFAAEEQGLAALGKSPEANVLRERLKAKKLALIQYKRDRDFDLQSALEAADKITLPTGRRGAGAGEGGGNQRGAWNQKDLYDAAVKSLQPEFMDKGPLGEQVPAAIPIERVRTRMREIENGQDMTPDILPMGSVPSTTSQTSETPPIEVPQDVQMGAQEMYAKARETMSVEEAKKSIEMWIRSQVNPIGEGGDGVDMGGSLMRLRGKQPVSKPKKKEPVRTGVGEDYMRDPKVRAALATKPKPRG